MCVCAKISKYLCPGGGEEGVSGTNFQLLMLSSNLLKSKIPISGGEVGGWGWWNQLSTFDAEFKFAKIQNSYVQGGGGGGGWGVGGTNFQLLMLSSNLLKFKIPMARGGGWWNQLSTFDAEFKFAKIENSYVGKGVGGTSFQLLMLSSNLLKSKIPISGGGDCGNHFSTFLKKVYFKCSTTLNSKY